MNRLKCSGFFYAFSNQSRPVNVQSAVVLSCFASMHLLSRALTLEHEIPLYKVCQSGKVVSECTEYVHI